MILVAASAVLGACSRQPKVEDASMVRISDADRLRVSEAEQRVSLATTNLNATEAGVNEAKQFRDITASELSAAKSEADAAKDAAALGRQTRDPAAATLAERTRVTVDARVRAGRAKEEFADALVELREEKRNAARARVSLAEAERELVKFDAAKGSGTGSNQSRSDFLNAMTKATEEVEKADARVRKQEQRTNQLREAWLSAKGNVKGEMYRDVAPPDEPPTTTEPPGTNRPSEAKPRQ